MTGDSTACTWRTTWYSRSDSFSIHIYIYLTHTSIYVSYKYTHVLYSLVSIFKVLYNRSAITIGKCIKIWQLIQAIKKADSDISTPADIQLKKPCHRLQKKLNIFSMPFPLQLRETPQMRNPLGTIFQTGLGSLPGGNSNATTLVELSIIPWHLLFALSYPTDIIYNLLTLWKFLQVGCSWCQEFSAEHEC